jgi:hypothetical protein
MGKVICLDSISNPTVSIPIFQKTMELGSAGSGDFNFLLSLMQDICILFGEPWTGWAREKPLVL